MVIDDGVLRVKVIQLMSILWVRVITGEIETRDMVRVNLEVPEETKREWQKEAENDPNAGGNLSGFIRSAVSEKINQSDSEVSHGGDIHSEITELKSMVNQLSQSLETTNARLREIEGESKSDPETEKLANELFSRLPTKDDFESWHSGKGESMKLGDYPEQEHTTLKAERGGSPRAFAELMNVTPLQIHDCIDWLRNNTPLIQEEKINGETRIYREG